LIYFGEFGLSEMKEPATARIAWHGDKDGNLRMLRAVQHQDGDSAICDQNQAGTNVPSEKDRCQLRQGKSVNEHSTIHPQEAELIWTELAGVTHSRGDCPRE
jgi:hypothetical protein